MKKIKKKRILAVLAGFLLIAILGAITDTMLQYFGVLPIPTEQRFENWHSALALTYHLLYAFLGGYVTARLAPDRHILSAAILGGIGVIMSIMAQVAIVTQNLAPLWYAYVLMALAIPVTCSGGIVYLKVHHKREQS